MAGVMADQGHVQHHAAAPPPASTSLQVAPENVLDLAEMLQSVIDTVQNASQRMMYDLQLPPDAFLGDPFSKWAVEEFNEYFVNAENSFVNIVTKLVAEHKKTFNALHAVAESYGKTDEWNARHLRDGYGPK